MMVSDTQDPVRDKIREKINGASRYLHISRLPDKTYSQFIDLSHEEFCSDHGMTLKHILDFYMGLIPTGLEHLESQLEQLRSEIVVLKQDMMKLTEDKKNKKPSRMDGTKTRIDEGE